MKKRSAKKMFENVLGLSSDISVMILDGDSFFKSKPEALF